MKRTIIIALIALGAISCKKGGSSDPEQNPNVETGIQLKTQFGTRLSTGEIVYSDEKTILQIWDTKGHDISMTSINDALDGYMYDNTDKKSIKAIHQDLGSNYKVKLNPGNYLVFVIISRTTGSAAIAYSYKTFKVDNSGYLKLTKKFSYDAIKGRFEDWDKNP